MRGQMTRTLRARRASWIRTPAGAPVAAAFLAILASCSGLEDKRIRQLLTEKGFGSRASGVATLENYVAGGDLVQFIIEPAVFQQAGAEMLFLLQQGQAVGIDGTIFVPYLGPIPALGMTEADLGALISRRLSDLFTFPVAVHVRIVSTGKAFYMFGEVSAGAHRVPITKADLTLIDVIAQAPVTSLANFGRIRVIRPDAQSPLVIVVNFREMVETGYTAYNLRIQDNDIIYVPPTFFGHISRFLEKLLQPIGVAVNALFSVASIRSSYDYVFQNDTRGFYFGGAPRF
jgi:protein involved in polysaccharide export with SLBB domain